MSSREARIPEEVVWQMCRTKATAAQWRVLGCLYAHAKDGRCFPAIDTIAKLTELNRRTVMGAVAALEGSGLVEVTRPTVRGSRQHSIYQLMSGDQQTTTHELGVVVNGVMSGDQQTTTHELGVVVNGVMSGDQQTTTHELGVVVNGVMSGGERRQGVVVNRPPELRPLNSSEELSGRQAQAPTTAEVERRACPTCGNPVEPVHVGRRQVSPYSFCPTCEVSMPTRVTVPVMAKEATHA